MPCRQQLLSCRRWQWHIDFQLSGSRSQSLGFWFGVFFFIFVPGMIQYHRLGKWLCWVIGIAVPVGLICACVCLSEIKWVPIC